MAGDLDAYLIGFTAAAVRPIHASELGPDTDNTFSEALVRQNRQRLSELKKAFYNVAGDGCISGWRDSEALPTHALLENARIADLIISGTPQGAGATDIYRHVDPGHLVCAAGRPVLFVAEDRIYRHPECAVIGWKDTAEARRAVVFALPFLQLAKRILVITVQEEDAAVDTGAKDIVRYLARRGIGAESREVESKKGPDGFLEALDSEGADLVVTGAYGHSRFHERLFGGFTRTLLMRNDLNRLMAG